MGQCPHCDYDIDYVRYSAEQRVYGTATRSARRNDLMHTHDDTGDTDNYSYECPECEHELSWEEACEALGQETASPAVPPAWNTAAPAQERNCSVNPVGVRIS
jgi:hypothetical protein